MFHFMYVCVCALTFHGKDTKCTMKSESDMTMAQNSRYNSKLIFWENENDFLNSRQICHNNNCVCVCVCIAVLEQVYVWTRAIHAIPHILTDTQDENTNYLQFVKQTKQKKKRKHKWKRYAYTICTSKNKETKYNQCKLYAKMCSAHHLHCTDPYWL